MSERSVQEKVDFLHTWLNTEGVDYDMPTNQNASNNSFLQDYCDLLRNELDIPLDRVYFGTALLHPQVAMRTFIWEYPGIVTRKDMSKEELETMHEERMKLNGPVARIFNGAPFVRIRPTDKDFPIAACQWMIDDGYTDFYVLPATGSEFGIEDTMRENMRECFRQVKERRESLSSTQCFVPTKKKVQGMLSWSTKKPGGFTDDQIEVLNKSFLSLTTCIRLHLTLFEMHFLMKAYLGDDAGDRVFRGDIERGDGMTIRCVIMFCDVRNFTRMSGILSRAEVINVINGVFEITDEVVRKYKGQILKYMGDGCMIIFSNAGTEFQRESFSGSAKQSLDDTFGAKLCTRAMIAAAQIQEKLAILKREREEQGLHGVNVGIGLHYGDCAYGNVGSAGRMDFTIIGPSVNLASRIESLCSKIHADVLATEEFMKLSGCCPDSWTSRGQHEVKGVSDPVTVYELNRQMVDKWYHHYSEDDDDE